MFEDIEDFSPQSVKGVICRCSLSMRWQSFLSSLKDSSCAWVDISRVLSSLLRPSLKLNR